MQTASLQSPLIVSAVGTHIGIDVASLPPALRDAVMGAWDDARLYEQASAHVTVRAAPDTDEARTLSDLSSAVTHAAITAQRGELWMLHAAGLAAPDGGVVVLVGQSGAGKTTATSVLARSYGYVSDETIGIEAGGRVYPHRKPLSVVTLGEALKVQHPPRRLGLLALPAAPLYLRRIILLDRAPGNTDAQLSDVSLAEAVAALSEQSSALTAMPTPLQTMTSLIRSTGGVLRASYAEAQSLGPLLEDTFKSGTQPADAAEGREAFMSTLPPDPAADPMGVRYRRRSDVVDWCTVSDDQIAVLTSEVDGRGTLRVLGPLASALWHASKGSTRNQLAAGLAPHRVGADPAVDFTLAQLVDAGLLTIDM